MCDLYHFTVLFCYVFKDHTNTDKNKFASPPPPLSAPTPPPLHHPPSLLLLVRNWYPSAARGDSHKVQGPDSQNHRSAEYLGFTEFPVLTSHAADAPCLGHEWGFHWVPCSNITCCWCPMSRTWMSGSLESERWNACAQTRPQFIFSSEIVFGEWSQKPC